MYFALPVMSQTPPALAIQPLAFRRLASTLLPEGYLSTRGNQIIDAAGRNVRIASVGWNQNFADIPATVAAMATAGFNTIRVSWDDADLDKSRSPTSLVGLARIVAAASANRMKVIIDHHNDEGFTNPADGYGAQQENGLWYDRGPGTDDTNGAGVTGTVSQARFRADWVRVARAFAGNPTVIGFDIDNEPTSLEITWGPYGRHGGYGTSDIHAMYQDVGNAIQAVDPGALIICEGPQNYSNDFAGNGPAPEGDLSVAGKVPVVLGVPGKVVYSVHDYPTEISSIRVDSGPAAVRQMNRVWGYLITDNIAPVWVGEMGSSMISENSKDWAATLIGYMNGEDGALGGPVFAGTQQPVSGDWWVWGYLPGQAPNGTLAADSSLRAEQQAVWQRLLPRATRRSAPPIGSQLP